MFCNSGRDLERIDKACSHQQSWQIASELHTLDDRVVCIHLTYSFPMAMLHFIPRTPHAIIFHPASSKAGKSSTETPIIRSATSAKAVTHILRSSCRSRIRRQYMYFLCHRSGLLIATIFPSAFRRALNLHLTQRL